MIQRSSIPRERPFYIESDGKPMGESQLHILNMRYLLEPLDAWFAADPQVYVNGNMFVHYERGNRNRHVSPDVMVVRGVPKVVEPMRRNFRVWEEGRGPDLVVELTSESTREEDQSTKRTIYQDILHVSEYFLFDPFEEYLHPRFQGWRLRGGVYHPIRMMKGRLSSKVLGLHLEAEGELLRLFDPASGQRLAIPPEVREAREQADEARGRAEAEVERLRRELEELRRRLPPS